MNKNPIETIIGGTSKEEDGFICGSAAGETNEDGGIIIEKRDAGWRW